MKITVETNVSAPIGQVWSAYTTPEAIKKWNAASDDWHTTAASVRPPEAREVEAKALDLMVPVLGAARANEVIAAVANLEQFGPVSGLRRLLQA